MYYIHKIYLSIGCDKTLRVVIVSSALPLLSFNQDRTANVHA